MTALTIRMCPSLEYRQSFTGVNSAATSNRRGQGKISSRCSLESLATAIEARGQLYTWQQRGFWKSVDTSKDQQKMERLGEDGEPPWERR